MNLTLEQQVSSILKAARPKIQKWISDAQTDDPESLGAFSLLVFAQSF
jgi:hypothetical protein